MGHLIHLLPQPNQMLIALLRQPAYVDNLLIEAHSHAASQLDGRPGRQVLDPSPHLDELVHPLVHEILVVDILQVDIFFLEELRLGGYSALGEAVERKAEEALLEDPEDHHHAALRIGGSQPREGQLLVSWIRCWVGVGDMICERDELALLEVSASLSGDDIDVGLDWCADGGGG